LRFSFLLKNADADAAKVRRSAAPMIGLGDPNFQIAGRTERTAVDQGRFRRALR